MIGTPMCVCVCSWGGGGEGNGVSMCVYVFVKCYESVLDGQCVCKVL